VEKEARTLREAARPYGQGARDMIWRGQVATAFRTKAEADVKQVNSLATRLEELAAAIRRGAKEARNELARQEREAREARETAAAGGRNAPR
jgi:uncharacterized protein YukE